MDESLDIFCRITEGHKEWIKTNRKKIQKRVSYKMFKDIADDFISSGTFILLNPISINDKRELLKWWLSRMWYNMDKHHAFGSEIISNAALESMYLVLDENNVREIW